MQRPLDGGPRRHRVGGPGEDGEAAVPLAPRPDDDPAVLRHRLLDEGVVAQKGGPQGQGILRTPLGHSRVRVLPSPWELELMGGLKAESAEIPDGLAGAVA